ncbi:MAG: PD40 domain-containing protein [Solirubrobacterales bacterium]|nr:PD40 domain-containing protein [Solirubrobacterales bacterium]
MSTATWASIPGQNGPMLISASVSSGGIPFSGLFDIHLGGKSTRASPIGETINSAAVSPNGALLAFSRSPGDQVWLGDRREIEKQGSLAGAIQISGIGASASDPEFSPDGRSIFYSSFLYSSGEGIEIWQVCRYWISSGKTQKLVSQFPVLETSPVPAVSPNGRLLAYSYQSPAGARIRLVRLGDRSSWTLPSNGEARLGNFSPDGSRLAYIRGPLGGSNLTVSRLDGMDSRTLGQADGIPSFSPDGTLVGVTRGYPEREEIVVFRLSDDHRKVLSAPGSAWQLWDWPRRRPFALLGFARHRSEISIRVFNSGRVRLSGFGIKSLSTGILARGTHRLKVHWRERYRRTRVRIKFRPIGGLSSTRSISIQR